MFQSLRDSLYGILGTSPENTPTSFLSSAANSNNLDDDRKKDHLHVSPSSQPPTPYSQSQSSSQPQRSHNSNSSNHSGHKTPHSLQGATNKSLDIEPISSASTASAGGLKSFLSPSHSSSTFGVSTSTTSGKTPATASPSSFVDLLPPHASFNSGMTSISPSLLLQRRNEKKIALRSTLPFHSSQQAYSTSTTSLPESHSHPNAECLSSQSGGQLPQHPQQQQQHRRRSTLHSVNPMTVTSTANHEMNSSKTRPFARSCTTLPDSSALKPSASSHRTRESSPVARLSKSVTSPTVTTSTWPTATLEVENPKLHRTGTASNRGKDGDPADAVSPVHGGDAPLPPSVTHPKNDPQTIHDPPRPPSSPCASCANAAAGVAKAQEDLPTGGLAVAEGSHYQEQKEQGLHEEEDLIENPPASGPSRRTKDYAGDHHSDPEGGNDDVNQLEDVYYEAEEDTYYEEQEEDEEAIAAAYRLQQRRMVEEEYMQEVEAAFYRLLLVKRDDDEDKKASDKDTEAMKMMAPQRRSIDRAGGGGGAGGGAMEERRINMKWLRELSWHGCPAAARGTVWRILTGYAPPTRSTALAFLPPHTTHHTTGDTLPLIITTSASAAAELCTAQVPPSMARKRRDYVQFVQHFYTSVVGPTPPTARQQPPPGRPLASPMQTTTNTTSNNPPPSPQDGDSASGQSVERTTTPHSTTTTTATAAAALIASVEDCSDDPGRLAAGGPSPSSSSLSPLNRKTISTTILTGSAQPPYYSAGWGATSLRESSPEAKVLNQLRKDLPRTQFGHLPEPVLVGGGGGLSRDCPPVVVDPATASVSSHFPSVPLATLGTSPPTPHVSPTAAEVKPSAASSSLPAGSSSSQPLCHSFVHHPRVQATMERVLFCWSLRHPASGYVQGMSDLLAPFLSVVVAEFACPSSHSVMELLQMDPVALNQALSEEAIPESIWRGVLEPDVYALSGFLLDITQGHYTQQQAGFLSMVERMDSILQQADPTLHQHLSAIGIETVQYAFRWMTCLLMRELQPWQVLRLLDAYLSVAGDEEEERPSEAGTAAAAAAAGGIMAGNKNDGTDRHRQYGGSSSSGGDQSSIGDCLRLHVFTCVALVLHFAPTLMSFTEFADALTFLQQLPTDTLSSRDIDELLAETFLIQSVFDK